MDFQNGGEFKKEGKKFHSNATNYRPRRETLDKARER
jgi:hypothetical protein